MEDRQVFQVNYVDAICSVCVHLYVLDTQYQAKRRHLLPDSERKIFLDRLRIHIGPEQAVPDGK